MKKMAALAVALVCVVVACGGGGDGGSGSGDAVGGELGEPVRIVSLFTTEADSPSSSGVYFAEGAELAIEQINAAGGIGGHPVEYERIPQTPDNDPEEALAALNEALDEEPTVVLGPLTTTIIQQEAGDIAASGLPFVFMATTPDAFAESGSAPVENAFQIKPAWGSLAEAGAEAAIERYQPDTVGLFCSDTGVGAEVCPVYREVAEDNDVEVCEERESPISATDFTEDAIAMRCADVVMAAHFPQPFTVFVRQLGENGVEVPVLHQGVFLYEPGLIPAPFDTNSLAYADCAPSLQVDRPESVEFAEAFEAEYGIEAEYTAAEAYDAVMLSAEAINQAQSAEPEAVIEAFRNLTYSGACMDYAADEEHVLGTSGVVLSWDAADGHFNIESTADFRE